MFDELDGGNTNDGEEQRIAIQQNIQNDIPMGEFGSGDEMDDFLGDEDDDLQGTSPRQPPAQQSKSTENTSENPTKNGGEKEGEMGTDSEDEEPIAPTQLGYAIDSLMMHWCQLLTNVSVKAPVPPPSTLDHVKEVAEVCSKHFRDASVDVNNEFTRLGVQWEMEQFLEHSVTEDANLDEAIERQNQLIEAAKEILRTRVETYNLDNPNAGKQFTT